MHQNTIRSVDMIHTTFVLLFILAAVNNHRFCQELAIMREQKNKSIVFNCFSSVGHKQKVKHHTQLDDEEPLHFAHPFLHFVVVFEAKVHEIHYAKTLKSHPALFRPAYKRLVVFLPCHALQLFIPI